MKNWIIACLLMASVCMAESDFPRYVVALGGPDHSEVNDETGKTESRIMMPGYVCDLNSTTNWLGVDEEFTGDWEDTINYGMVCISVLADQASDAIQIRKLN